APAAAVLPDSFGRRLQLGVRGQPRSARCPPRFAAPIRLNEETRRRYLPGNRFVRISTSRETKAQLVFEKSRRKNAGQAEILAANRELQYCRGEFCIAWPTCDNFVRVWPEQE